MFKACSSGTTTASTPLLASALALARAFGCVRVVFNDGLRARQEAYAAGRPYLTDGELSARLTAAKATPERAWLGEVSAVVLQQSLADLNAAYLRFFAYRKALRDWRAAGREGPRHRGPGCRSSSPLGWSAGDQVHRQRPVQDSARRPAPVAEDRGHQGPLVP